MSFTWSQRVKPFTDSTYSIGGDIIPVKEGSMPISDLKYWAGNPRVFSEVNLDGDTLDQKEIQDILWERDHVRKLRKIIKEDGAINERVAVLDNSFDVLEGNSRLAAARFLADNIPSFGKIKVTVFPDNIDAEQILRYLSEHHIQGKTAWSPYEKAGLVYRSVEDKGMDMPTVAEATGLGPKKAQTAYDTYAFMLAHNENDRAKWSYYETMFNSNPVKKARREHSELDNILVQEIQARRPDEGGESVQKARATEFRERLTTVCKNPKQTRKLAAGTNNLDDSWKKCEEQGDTSDVLEKLKRIENSIRNIRVQDFDSLGNKTARKRAENAIATSSRRLKRLLTEVFR